VSERLHESLARDPIQNGVRFTFFDVDKVRSETVPVLVLSQKTCEVGQDELLRINNALVSMNPKTFGEADIHTQLFATLKELFTARRLRSNPQVNARPCRNSGGRAVKKFVGQDAWPGCTRSVSCLQASAKLYKAAQSRGHHKSK
jgi:hypothetical protein